MGLEELADVGELEKLPSNWHEIKGLLKKARRKLKDANSDSISNETRLEQVYNVILTVALIGLRAKGFRILAKSSAHYTAIETLRQTLGLDSDKLEYFQSLRTLRHRDIYDVELVISSDDLNEAILEATSLLNFLQEWLPDNFKR